MGTALNLKNEKAIRNFMIVGNIATRKDIDQGRFRRRSLTILFLLSISFVMVGCSSTSSNSANPAPTATLTANPNSVCAGADTTVSLAFTSTNANSGTISGQGLVGVNSQVTFTEPTTTTTYVYTATGPGGTATASATVTVNPTPPLSVNLTAYPTVAVAGQGGAPLTLNWTSSNAATITISGVPNGPVGVPVNGNYTFFNSATTTYTATAYGTCGQQPVTSVVKVPVDPITSFDGLTSGEVEGGSTEDDIDPNGAVGLTQYMEYVNTSYQAYSKTPPYAPVWPTPQLINTPWPSSSPCAQSGSQGPAIQLDSVINYDRLASRWVIAAKTTVQNDYNFCIAVSNMDDLTNPNFAWYAYSWNLNNSLMKDSNGNYFQPDWPKLGTWSDGYYVGMDLIDPTSKDESGILMCVFDRTNMLINSTPTPAFACYNNQDASRISSELYLSHSPIPADIDGTTPPPAGRDEFMMSIQNPANPFGTDGTNTSSTLNLWDLHVDWTPPATLTLEAVTAPTVNTYTPGCYTQASPGQTICVPEMGVVNIGGIKIDSVGDRLMPRFTYRNFASAAAPYESFLISHTVQTDLGQDQEVQQTGIRWYELRANGSGTPALSSQGTISPDSVFYRFLPSIAEDKAGNAVAGYSISNPNNNPGISLSYWNLNPVGANQPYESTIINGPGEEIPLTLNQNQVPNLGQWGSYSTLTVDPTDDCTFWYVNEYWPANTTGLPGPWSTNIAYFQIPGCQ